MRQRWGVVYSEAADAREKAPLEKQVARERAQAQKALWHLRAAEFSPREEAQAALETEAGAGKYHLLEAGVLEVPPYARRGRPAHDQLPAQIGFRVGGEIVVNPQAIQAALQTKGKFVLATHDLDVERLPPDTLLGAYKGQGTSGERGFRFLKDPLFFASSLFLEKPERIMALGMVMGLSLLVYALADHALRTELAARKQTVPDQRGKPTSCPTMRRIFQVFEGSEVLRIEGPAGDHRRGVNLRPVHRHVLEVLGPEVQQCYLPDQ